MDQYSCTTKIYCLLSYIAVNTLCVYVCIYEIILIKMKSNVDSFKVRNSILSANIIINSFSYCSTSFNESFNDHHYIEHLLYFVIENNGSRFVLVIFKEVDILLYATDVSCRYDQQGPSDKRVMPIGFGYYGHLVGTYEKISFPHMCHGHLIRGKRSPQRVIPSRFCDIDTVCRYFIMCIPSTLSKGGWSKIVGVLTFGSHCFRIILASNVYTCMPLCMHVYSWNSCFLVGYDMIHNSVGFDPPLIVLL